MTEKKFDIKNPNEIYYQPFGEEAYDEEAFVDGYSKLSGLEQALSEIKQDPQSTTAYKYAGGIIYGNENFYYQTKESPRPVLERAVPEGRKGLEEYVLKNKEPILENFGDEEYKYLVMAVPLSKVKEEGEHKTIVDTINEFKVVQEATEDPSKKIVYLSEKMKKAPKYIQEEFARYSSNEAFTKQLFANYASYVSHNVGEVLEKGDCEGVFKKSLDEAKNKTPFCRGMANILYQKLTSQKKAA